MKMTILGMVLISSLLMIGCASQSDLDDVRQTAENAQRTASSAAECCALNGQKVDRMYQKLMAK